MSSSPLLYHLGIGELIACKDPSAISTVLGSCVSVCLYSRRASMGGMIHYALPSAPPDVIHDDSFRYGELAIPSLVAELQMMTGEDPKHLAAKITGGAAQVNGQPAAIQAGPHNVKIAKEILHGYGIPIVGEDIGGTYGRKVIFHTGTGRLQVSAMNKSSVQGHACRVLVVDSSSTFAQLTARMLTEDKELQVIGATSDLSEANTLALQGKPDVIVMDVQLPRLNVAAGVPIVALSTSGQARANEAARVLEIGAVHYIQLPSSSDMAFLGPVICDIVKGASTAKLQEQAPHMNPVSNSGAIDQRKVIAIGASTGGTNALMNVMCALPAQIPPILIVQHIPGSFSRPFAERLNEMCPFEVKEASDGDEVKPSRVLIAPGGKQMKMEQTNRGLFVRITNDAPVSGHKPSVDYLFHSVAKTMGSKAVGVILTGMGADGAKGLLQMRTSGAKTIGQDEKSCVVYGMPRVAYEIGAVERVAALADIPRAILSCVEKK